MRSKMIAAVGAALMLTGCLSKLPLQRPEHAIQAPILEEQAPGQARYRSIGPSVLTQNLTLPSRDDLDNWEVFGDAAPIITAFFPYAHGPTMERLASYLAQDARQTGGQLIRYASPPTVHLWANTKPSDMDNAVKAVQVVNASLPDHWQLEFSDVPYSDNDRAVPPGNIVIVFASADGWPQGASGPNTLGVHIPNGNNGVERSSFILIDTERSGEATLNVVVHELIHALGRGHINGYLYPDSVMTPYDGSIVGQPILKPLDDAALYAVYDRLSPGTRASDIHLTLGPWSREGYAFAGGFEVSAGDLRAPIPILTDGLVVFGVLFSNDRLQAGVTGPEPAVYLDKNPYLLGAVSWEGRLVGGTPEFAAVAGDARLTVHLSRLNGTLSFTELETWGAGIMPGKSGTGRLWGDGDLSYGIVVRENTFIQAPRNLDKGVVTGGFFGLAHEGMAGTLKRDDLTAAFGGKR